MTVNERERARKRERERERDKDGTLWDNHKTKDKLVDFYLFDET